MAADVWEPSTSVSSLLARGVRVLAGMNVNIFGVNEVIQAVVHGGRAVDAGRLANPDVPLEEFLGDRRAAKGKPTSGIHR